MPQDVILIQIASLNRHFLRADRNDWVQAPNLDVDGFAWRTVIFDRHCTRSLPCIPARREIWASVEEFWWRRWGPLEPWDEPIAYHAIPARCGAWRISCAPTCPSWGYHKNNLLACGFAWPCFSLRTRSYVHRTPGYRPAHVQERAFFSLVVRKSSRFEILAALWHFMQAEELRLHRRILPEVQDASRAAAWRCVIRQYSVAVAVQKKASSIAGGRASDFTRPACFTTALSVLVAAPSFLNGILRGLH